MNCVVFALIIIIPVGVISYIILKDPNNEEDMLDYKRRIFAYIKDVEKGIINPEPLPYGLESSKYYKLIEELDVLIKDAFKKRKR